MADDAQYVRFKPDITMCTAIATLVLCFFAVVHYVFLRS